MNIPMEMKRWQDMTKEEQAEDHKKPYNHWTVRRMLEANERTTTDKQGWGMTVADLVAHLVGYPPHTEVLNNGEDDYDAQRKELLAGKVRGKRVVALVKCNYEAETVDPHDAEEYQEEE